MIDVIKAKLGEVTEEKSVGESDSTGIKGVNKSFRLTNKNGDKFLFKPQSGDHTSKWRYIPAHTQYKRERAAYLTAEALGWELVPDTKIVSHNDEIGSLQDWIEKTTKSDKTLDSYSPHFIWEAGLIDIIIGNVDRHSGNWLTMKNKPILIDHGYSFPVKAEKNDPRSVILSRFAFRVWGKPIPNALYKSIENLTEPKFQEHIHSLVGEEAFKLFTKRVNELLQTHVAQVENYKCVERVKGVPPKADNN